MYQYTNKSSRFLHLLGIFFITVILVKLSATAVLAQVPTDPNFKVAFIGDTGMGSSFTSVLNLIKSEGAQAVLHQGDFDYAFNPSGFFAKVDSVLGGTFPYFASVGNHDDSSWNEGCSDPDGCYAKFIKDRMARIGVVPDNPDLNDHIYSATYKGLKMVFVGQNGASTGDNTYAPYIQSQLQSDSHTWKVCSWHKNQNTMQVGGKGDEMGWKVYENCRSFGAIIATAHEHTYERTKTLTNIQSLTVDTVQHPKDGAGVPQNPNSLLVAPGKTFVFVSGLGGNGPRNQDRCLPTTYPYGGGSGCNYIWASIYTTDQGGSLPFGALFITFNVDGNPNKARGYFKTLSGQVVDQFEINKSASAVTPIPTQPITPGQPTNTPIPPGQPTNTPLPPNASPTPQPTGPSGRPVCIFWKNPGPIEATVTPTPGIAATNTPTPGGPTLTRTPTPRGPTPTRTPTPRNPTPTPTGGPSPTLPPGGSAYRAFSADSYWNTPFPANAPIDPNNAKYIADSQNSSHTQNFLQFTAAPGTSQGFGQPIYWATSSDKLYTVTDGNRTVQVHIPSNARPATGSDGQITIYDLSTDQVVGMSGASYNSSTDKWTVGGSVDRYILSSNGLDSKAAGSNDSRNTGHRGTTSAVRAVRVDEVQKGAINHRLACFWWATGVQTVNHYWPMVGDEGAKGGIVPEGIVIRIKPSVNLSTRGLSQPALVIAKALQNYGCLITDNSGSGNRLKLELNETAWKNIGLTYNALAPFPWSDWEFVKGGYKP